MVKELGHVCELVRYPVKSMAGTGTESAFLGWHGLDGDRRFAFRRLGDDSGFPWLTASRVAELLLYHPVGLDESSGEPLPTHIRTPAGARVELRSAELQKEVAERYGSGVELMKLKHGIFDDASVSMISLATIAGISGEAGVTLDRRRFRANIVLETRDGEAFLEDEWVGGTLVFGNSEPRPAVNVTLRDVRCVMINLDPDTGKQDACMLKTVVRLNKNNAGVYGTVVQTGVIRVGDPSEPRIGHHGWRQGRMNRGRESVGAEILSRTRRRAPGQVDRVLVNRVDQEASGLRARSPDVDFLRVRRCSRPGSVGNELDGNGR